ncbi:unnamed protein product [Didymodactylos carnosus]|uniref:Uncharacterized protein n=1 Tax=Didymodactylos carnosus TaxID=1234261 RepID=A0A8S2CZK5_9BILA|nr:unnamed protein product [Didymodactylos carnosus]CAF3547723.1 unnamed protein product [Didymodactylos carnosus]
MKPRKKGRGHLRKSAANVPKEYELSSKREAKERPTRFSVTADSEVIDITPDNQSDQGNQQHDDDADYSPSAPKTTASSKVQTRKTEKSTSKEILIPIENQRQPTIIDNVDFNLNLPITEKMLTNGQLDFDRIYPSSTTQKRRKRQNDESSLSGSDKFDDEDDMDLLMPTKSNGRRDLTRKRRSSKKKTQADPTPNTDGPCSGCLKLRAELADIRKRLERIKKVVSIIKKFRSKTPAIATKKQTNDIFANNDAYARVKCLIRDDDIESHWRNVIASISRQAIDNNNNSKMKISQSTPVRSSSTPALATISPAQETTPVTKPLSSQEYTASVSF